MKIRQNGKDIPQLEVDGSKQSIPPLEHLFAPVLEYRGAGLKYFQELVETGSERLLEKKLKS